MSEYLGHRKFPLGLSQQIKKQYRYIYRHISVFDVQARVVTRCGGAWFGLVWFFRAPGTNEHVVSLSRRRLVPISKDRFLAG